MRHGRIARIAIAALLVPGMSGLGNLATAQTTDAVHTGQPTAGAAAPPNGAGASEQNRTGGEFNPGGVPTKNQATTQPSVPPNGVGASEQKPPGGDIGPGGAPTTGQAATHPSRDVRGNGAGTSDAGKARE